MPPKSKRSKNSGISKENVCVSTKLKSKSVSQITKNSRRALADKTNSASDDNEPQNSLKGQIHTKSHKSTKNVDCKIEHVDTVRTRRNRRLPERFVENQVLLKLNRIEANSINDKSRVVSQKKPVVSLSPLKKCDYVIETSIADSRPKRICHLPSKFEDHSISPSKYLPVQPIQASTPIVPKNSTKKSSKGNNIKDKLCVNKSSQTLQAKPKHNKSSKENSMEENCSKNEDTSIQKSETRNGRSAKLLPVKNVVQKKQTAVKRNKDSNKKLADTNNNANELNQRKNLHNTSKSCTGDSKKQINNKRFLENNYSFKVFDDKKKGTKREVSTLDVYEFTYDPTEEPPPQKKKRKRAPRKKQEKPKAFFTNNYDKNVAKSLAVLKSALSMKSFQCKPKDGIAIKERTQNKVKTNYNVNNDMKNVIHKSNNTQDNIIQQNFNSFHIEDIVLDHESVGHDHNDINYSPINSPNYVRVSLEPKNVNSCTNEGTANNDPLNLQDDISFFDEHPAASSSMNVSVRNPSATPWRVEFGQLPIKWQVNTYVKPNMTPAFESSFINFSNKKKHVYTNMVLEENDVLPEIVETEENTSRLKQTSIISFIKEVVEKSANKKSKLKSTPVKENSIFEDISNTSVNAFSPVKQITSNSVNKSVTPDKKISSENVTSSKFVSDTDNLNAVEHNHLQLNSSQKEVIQSKNKEKDITFFGFDESEEQDQENISPKKKLYKHRIKALRPRSKAVLQEFNVQTGPTRVNSIMTKKNNAKANIIRVFDEIKDDQGLPEKTVENNPETTNSANNTIITNAPILCQDDSQPVHLFEDLESVYRVKPSRKSYCKAKKVTIRQNSVLSDTPDSDVGEGRNESSAEEDDLHDLTFHLPSVEPKKTLRKKKIKNQLSKKEEKEVDAWAAGFNSMCEDVDHFDLVVE